MLPILRRNHETLFALLVVLLDVCAPTPPHAGGSGPAGGHNCPPQGNPSCNDPVTIGTGNLFVEATDYESGGQNKLTLKRYYNSYVNTGLSCCDFLTTFRRWRSN